MSKTTEIVAKLLDAKKKYYDGNPIISDAKFDALEDELRELDPENGYFNIVGASLGNIKEKVTHKNPMYSCGKAKTAEDVHAWLKKIESEKEPLIVQAKIDGMSSNFVYVDGKLDHVASRGDGFIGQVITHVANFINVPKEINLKGRVEIRGELYIPKDSKVPNPENNALRNICGGLIGRKGGKHSLEDLKYIHFVAYQALGTKMLKESLKMGFLKARGFETVEFELIKADQIESFYKKYLASLRTAWPYESDGLVLTVDDNEKWEKINSKYEVSHHNHYNIALKPPSQSKETTLEGIEWNVSRSGKLIPIALFKTINVGGANISRASLTSYENVIKMKMEKGDTILVSRANDVIPYVEENVTKKVSQR